MDNETATKRIPVKPSTFEDFRDFCRGLNMEYSDCLQFIFQQLVKEGESPIEAGLRYRKQRSSSD